MATYASTTNPFLEKPKQVSTSNGLDRPLAKNAPGMARPQSLLDELKKSKENEDLLMSHVECSGIMKDIKLDESNEMGETKIQATSQMDTNNNINDKKQNGIDAPNLLEDVESEIAKTCQSLVETAAKLSLNDSGIDNHENGAKEGTSSGCCEKKTICSTNQSDKDEEEDDDDDNEEDESAEVFNESVGSQDDRKYQHIELIKKLRLQLRDLERYAYERGELKQAPASVLAERQTVIIETLKEKLSLNLDEDKIEKLSLNELKKEIDKEVNDLVDPLITKEYLLSQLKTQLTDLERYISHLHGTIGKNNPRKHDCSCALHGCSNLSSPLAGQPGDSTSIMGNDTLPRTTKLIRAIVGQLICSDIKIQEMAKKEKEFEQEAARRGSEESQDQDNQQVNPIQRAPQFHDGAAWTLHLDKVILSTDSLVNLFTLEPTYQRGNDKAADEALIESVVRRQLVPAIRDLLTYGLIDPSSFTRSTSYASFLFDPYYLFSSLTCFPSSQKSTNDSALPQDKLHIWNIVVDYYQSRSGPNFKQSSFKTLSQSFNLTPSMDGPIKITSKQALLIAVDDIIDRLASCKPNGPESHLKLFIYTALNQCKLSTWLRIIFKNKSVIKKYYHNFSFVSQPEKMDKFLSTIECLNQFEFKLRTDLESLDRFVSAF